MVMANRVRNIFFISPKRDSEHNVATWYLDTKVGQWFRPTYIRCSHPILITVWLFAQFPPEQFPMCAIRDDPSMFYRYSLFALPRNCCEYVRKILTWQAHNHKSRREKRVCWTKYTICIVFFFCRAQWNLLSLRISTLKWMWRPRL